MQLGEPVPISAVGFKGASAPEALSLGLYQKDMDGEGDDELTVHNQEAGHPGKLATDFLQLLVLHEISKKLYHWKA